MSIVEVCTQTPASHPLILTQSKLRMCHGLGEKIKAHTKLHYMVNDLWTPARYIYMWISTSQFEVYKMYLYATAL